jgi:tetratricopeptide (TPR) repeat protein
MKLDSRGTAAVADVKGLFMRRLNVKLIVGLSALSLAMGAALFIVHHFQSGRIARALLWQAQKAEEKSQPDRAVQYLQRYLEFAPHDVETRAHLGQTLAADRFAASFQAREQALFNLERVLVSDPGRDDIRRLTVRVAMDLKRYQVAIEHLGILEKANGEDGELDGLLGQCRQALNEYADAAAAYRKAIKHSPHQIDYYARLVDLVWRGRDPAVKGSPATAADSLMDELVAHNRDSYQAYLIRARYRKEATQAPDWAAIAQDVERALQLAPSEADVLLAAAELAEAQSEIAKGRDYSARGIAAHPEDDRMYQIAARLELRGGKRRDAIQILRRGIAAVPPQNQQDLKWELANLLIDEKALTEVNQIIDSLRQVRANPASIDFLIARLAEVNEQWGDAAKALRLVRPSMEQFPRISTQIDTLLAECYERLDDPERQLEALNRLAARNPNSVIAHLKLAGALGRLGRFDDAVQRYRQIMNVPGVPASGWNEVVRLLILRNQAEGLDKWDEVEEALSRAEHLQPDSIEVVLLRADMLLAQKLPGEAKAVLEEARNRRPTEATVWRALAALADHEGRSEEALRLLQEGERQAGDSVVSRLAQAQYWANHPGPGATAALLKLATAVERRGVAEQAQVIEGVAQALSRAGEPGRACELLEALAKRSDRAHDLTIQRELFEFALQAGDEPKLQMALNEIKRIEGGEGPWWKYGQAMRLIRLAPSAGQPRLHEARTLLTELAAERPNWPALDFAKGQIEELNGHADRAITHYRDAMAHGERNPVAIRHLITLLFGQERYEEADGEIRKLQNDGPLPPELERLAVAVALENHDTQRALALARRTDSRAPESYQEHLWFGQVLAACARHEEATERFRRAVEMADRVPETWLALVRHLAVTGRSRDAEAAIGRARSKLPAEHADMTLAQCYESAGRMKEAEAHYRAALASRPNDPLILKSLATHYLHAGRLADAKSYLRQAIDGKVELPASDVAWARRTLALALATSGDYRDLEESLSLLGLDLEGRDVAGQSTGSADAVERLRAQSHVLATRNRSCFRKKAIKLLETLKQDGLLQGDDRLLLARLYEESGDWPSAREHFQSVLLYHGHNRSYLVEYAQRSLAHQELKEAEACVNAIDRIDRLHAQEPDAVATELKARLLEGGGRGEEAVNLLAGYATRQGARPSDLLLVAASLGRQKRPHEGLDWCERAWRTGDAVAVGAVSLSLIQTHQASKADVARVEGWLKAAISKHPTATVLVAQLAGVQEAQGNLAEAERLYRQLLQADGWRLVTANNLAWLLAQKPGGVAESLALINRAIDQYGPRADLLDTRAVAYLISGQTGPALADLTQAIEDSPSASRYLHLASVHETANDREAARKAFQQAKAAGVDPHRLSALEMDFYRKMSAARQMNSVAQ